MALLEVRDLHTSFHTPDGVVRAVDGVSFQVAEGETVGLVGESGCGKSVTAMSIMRLLPEPPAEVGGAAVTFDGHDLLAMSPEAIGHIRGNTMAMIFQDAMTALNPVLPIGQQVAEGMQRHLKIGAAEARERAIELLTLVGIPNAAQRVADYPHQFSGGMRQRVSIATALACKPKLILADEITTALDVTIQAQILDVLRTRTQDLRTAVVLITHDLGVVAGMTQRVYVMYAGQIVESATTRELFGRPSMPYTWGLLRSMPRLDSKRKEPLIPIEGSPPDLIQPPRGCRFRARCAYRREICQAEEPPLAPLTEGEPGHQTRCWGMLDVPGGGWLRAYDWKQLAADAPHEAAP